MKEWPRTNITEPSTGYEYHAATTDVYAAILGNSSPFPPNLPYGLRSTLEISTVLSKVLPALYFIFASRTTHFPYQHQLNQCSRARVTAAGTPAYATSYRPV